MDGVFFTDKPGKPGAPEFSDIKDTSLHLNWSPPEDDGGAEITNYVIEFRKEGDFKWVVLTSDSIPEPKFKATGLQTDVTYEFRVAAENKAGQGPFSDPSAPVKVKEPVCKY